MAKGMRSRNNANTDMSVESLVPQQPKEESNGTSGSQSRQRRGRRKGKSYCYRCSALCLFMASLLFVIFDPSTLSPTLGLPVQQPNKITGALSSSPPSSYTTLPKKAFTVIGKESSGTKFVTEIIRAALQIHSYREGGNPYEFFPKNRKTFRQDQENPVQVQHFSLPQGGRCQEDQLQNHNHGHIVDVVFPAQCSSPHLKKKGKKNRHGNPRNESHDKAIILQECQYMKTLQTSMAGYKDQNKNRTPRIRYPGRYFLNIASHKQWYDSHGTEQYIIIVVRDKEMSFKSRSEKHCAFANVAIEEERIATGIINDAIRTFMLGEDGESVVDDLEKREDHNMIMNMNMNMNMNSAWNGGILGSWKEEEDDLLWDPTRFDENDKDQDENDVLHSSLIPSKNNVVLVSYESMMKLKGDYVKQLYEQLGIESDHIPVFKDGNAKYTDIIKNNK